MIKLLVDCFGGDHSPQAPVAGALAALAKNPDLHLILTGDEAILRKELEGKAYDAARPTKSPPTWCASSGTAP